MGITERFIDVTYDEKHHPVTDYPGLLTKYLVDRFSLVPGWSLVDVGCGRGEYLQGFSKAGLLVSGVDRSNHAKKYCPEARIETGDIQETPLPFESETFDVVFNKSTIEHFYYPERLVMEMHRVLKPGGLLLTMTPDWVSQYKNFYEDFTHRTPFTRQSLADILLMHDFCDIHVERFRQLPFLWKWPILTPLCFLLGAITPRSKIKLVRFSKEVMLLGSARKAGLCSLR